MIIGKQGYNQYIITTEPYIFTLIVLFQTAVVSCRFHRMFFCKAQEIFQAAWQDIFDNKPAPCCFPCPEKRYQTVPDQIRFHSFQYRLHE